MFEQIRREVEDALNRNGMQVGLPKVTVDASQLKHLLNHYDACRAENERLRELVKAAYEEGWRDGCTEYDFDYRAAIEVHWRSSQACLMLEGKEDDS